MRCPPQRGWDCPWMAENDFDVALFGDAERPLAGNLPCSHARIWISTFDERTKFMTTEQELRQKLRKISALFEGPPTEGGRDAAPPAIHRVREALAAAEQIEKPVETYFKLVDQWNRRLFAALCRRYGLKPYRYPRQRRTTVVVRAPKSFIDKTLWPEYIQIEKALHEYLPPQQNLWVDSGSGSRPRV